MTDTTEHRDREAAHRTGELEVIERDEVASIAATAYE
jgi:hypothetical protein